MNNFEHLCGGIELTFKLGVKGDEVIHGGVRRIIHQGAQFVQTRQSVRDKFETAGKPVLDRQYLVHDVNAGNG